MNADRVAGGSRPYRTRAAEGVLVFELDNTKHGEEGRATAAPTRYATIGRFQEMLKLSGTRIVQLHKHDPRFPVPAVEIVEQRLVRLGWREAEITAYKRGKDPVPAGDPEQYLGYSVIAKQLGVTAERIRQLERKDPNFPLAAVELVGSHRASRQIIHKGWRREDVDAYVAARSAKLSARDQEQPFGPATSGRVP